MEPYSLELKTSSRETGQRGQSQDREWEPEDRTMEPLIPASLEPG